MNILLLSWRGPGHPNAGGAEISTHEHAKEWVLRGHNVTLFTSYYKGARKQDQVDGVNIIRRGGQFLGVHWEAFKWYNFTPHPKFDLVIDQFHGIPFFTPLYVKVKKLAFIHEVTKEVWRFNQLRFPASIIAATLGFLFEPLVFRLYWHIPFMTVSQSTKKDLMEWGIPEQNITVIHNGVKIPKNMLYKKQILKTVTFLGALAKDKGIEEAIKIFSILQKKYQKDFQYWVVGKADNRYLEILKQEVKKMGLADIKFWGYVTDRKKFELLAKSHVLINPSIREGWGLTVIEAARMGTPTVAFDVPGLRDSIKDGETGFLSKEFSIESLARKIIYLLDDEKKYTRMSHNAMIWSKNFSWDKASKLSMDLIMKIVR